MRKYKFLSLFKALNSAEKTAFSQFLQQHSRKDNKAADLYEFLMGSSAKMLDYYADDASRIPNHFFTDKSGQLKDNAQKDILNAFEQLFNKMAPRFLVRPGFQWCNWDDQLAWLKVLEQRGMETEYAQQIDASFKEITTTEKRSVHACIQALAIAQRYQQYVFANLSLFKKEEEVIQCLNIIQLLTATIQWRTACDLLNAGIYNSGPNAITLPTRIADDQIGANMTLLRLYQWLFEALCNQNQTAFEQALALFETHAKHLDPSEMQLAMRYLGNYLSQKLRNNQPVTPQEVFNIYKKADDNDIFKQKGILENGLFGNIADAACNCGQYNWLFSFLDKHKNYISPNLRDKMRLVAEATVAFCQKEFRKVIDIDCLNKFPNKTDHLRIKMLALKSAYELAEYFMVMEMCRNIERAAPSQIPSNTIIATMNFTKIIKQMALQKKTKQDIAKMVSSAHPLFNRPWLQEKLTTYNKFGA